MGKDSKEDTAKDLTGLAPPPILAHGGVPAFGNVMGLPSEDV